MTKSNIMVGTASQPPAVEELDHLRMHADHLQWFNENSLWRDDLACWQHEANSAMKQLEIVRAALEKHQEKLRQHAAAVRLYEQSPAEHEHELALFEQGGSGQKLLEMARSHQLESHKHGEQRKVHEALKRKHHELLARLAMLVKSLEALLTDSGST